MKTERLILDYNKYSDKDLLIISSNVVSKLTGNANFPVTKPTVAEYSAIQVAFAAAMQKAAGRDREQVALKNQAKELLTAISRELAMNIDSLCNGDKAKLLSSGFILASHSDGFMPLGTPSNFKILDGKGLNQLILQCSRAPNAVAYVFEYAYEEDYLNNQWTIITGTTRSVTISGLQSGKKVYARIKAIGRKGQESYSDTLWRIVQ